MKFSEQSSAASVNGIAALAVLRMLLETLEKKAILSAEEIDIIIHCAQAEVDIDNNTDVSGRIAEAKLLISGLRGKPGTPTITDYKARTDT